MASVFRPKYVMPIPAGAARCTVKGVPSVRYADGKGKVHTWPVHFDRRGKETGRMVCEQQTWWMRYRLPDGTLLRQKGFRDKLATEQEAARREREAQQAAAGLLIVDSAQLLKPLRSCFTTPEIADEGNSSTWHTGAKPWPRNCYPM
ncbi:MAG: hypothetical protein FJ288_03735, partial [Planctomycetes bacterium]|nr:hypothetical protein [Planctomycetota bacterium]